MNFGDVGFFKINLVLSWEEVLFILSFIMIQLIFQ